MQQRYTTITVLVSIILATSAFLAVTSSQPLYSINVSEEQAISILKANPGTSGFTDSDPSSLKSIRLEYLAINLQDYLKNISHSKLIVSPTLTDEVNPYWIADYAFNSTFTFGGSGYWGRYLVDAETGELVLAVEGYPWAKNVSDYHASLQPEAWNSSTPLKVKIGGYTPVTLTLTAWIFYNATLPVEMKVTDVPIDFSVKTNKTSAILSKGGSVSFIFNVSAPAWYPADFLPSQLGSKSPHIDVEIRFLGTTTTYPIYVLKTKS